MTTIREQKERQVEEIRNRFERAKAAILTDYRGINVEDMNALRKNLREAGVEYRVLKNSYTKIATEELGSSELAAALEGPTAIAFSYDDAVTAAKVLTEFNKTHPLKLPVIKAGVLEGKYIDAKQVTSLASLPPREVLLSQVLNVMQAPITSFVRTNAAIITKFLYALNAVKEQKETN